MTKNTDRQALNILHVASHNAIRAGGSVQMARLALGLTERGHRVCCVFNLKNGDRPPGHGTFVPLQDAGIPVVSFPMQRLRRFVGMLAFRKFVAKHRFDVIHAHRIRALNFVMQATRGITVPALVGNKKNSFPVDASQAAVYANPRVDRIVTNAGTIRDILLKTGRVAPEKIEIIYNGVMPETFHPRIDGTRVRASLHIDRETPVCIMVANFARKKSHNVFFEAAQQVLAEVPRTVFLLVGGGDYAPFQQKLREKGVGGQFVFTGFRRDIPELLAAADFSVVSSTAGEGLTGSLVEAMIMAKPVITTAVAGNKEVVTNNETGLLVEPGNARALAKAMLKMLESPDAARRMGQAARAFVLPLVDNNRRTERFEKLYYDIIDNKRGQR